ncbi:carotenoid oxygenase family protein [Streptomyces sp. CB01881]|uniref:carotenoid oxygenase family protein n=1 Tax=Streptomyces sp. CB01881 TaxID=2078691 RepID=UPI00321FAA43
MLTQAWGWPWIFHSVALGSALVLAAVAVLVPAESDPVTGRQPAGAAGRFDLAGTVTVTLSLTCLVWGLTTARGAGWDDGPVLGSLGAAAVLPTAFVVIERRRPDALIPPRLFTTGRVASGNLLMALLGVGAYDFQGRLRTAMTAHPKEDPLTGELHFFGSSPLPPFLTYYVADAKGEIVHSVEVPDATASLKHDFAITRHHVVFIEGNVTFDPSEHSGIPYGWSDEQPARIGVMPRGADGAGKIRWFSIEPGNMLHVTNAYEDDRGRIVLEGPTVDREGFRLSWNWWVGAPGRGSEPGSRSYTRRWVVDLAAGSVDERIVDDLPVEFPTLNEAYLGAENRYQYAVSFPDEQGFGGCGVVKYDRVTGARRIRRIGRIGDARLPSEAVFVPAAGATGEDEGYLLTVVSDLKQDSSQLLVLDASGLDNVATVHLTRRVPGGIHGSWIPDGDADARTDRG